MTITRILTVSFRRKYNTSTRLEEKSILYSVGLKESKMKVISKQKNHDKNRTSQ